MYIEMSNTYSIAELRSRLSHVIREAEAGETVEVRRRGEPVAVLLGLPEYERLRKGSGDFWKGVEAFRESVGAAELGIEPEEVFGDVRDRTPGRGVTL